MKLLCSLSLVVSLTLGAASWQYLKPQVEQNGTSVIYAMSTDGVSGGKPATIRLPDHLNPKQYELLSFAYDVARADGHLHPQYLQGIIMQESKAGGFAGYRVAGLTNKVGDHYFGIGQIKLAAAKAVMARYPDMWSFLESHNDEELQARLIMDDKFNIRVASKYLLMMHVNENPTLGITAYNQGEAGAAQVDPNTHAYTVSVKQHVSGEIKKVNDVKTSQAQAEPRVVAFR